MSNLSVKIKLTIATALAILVMLAINGFVSYQQSRSLLVNQIYSNLNTAGKDLAGFVSSWHANKLRILGGADQQIGNGDIRQILAQGRASGGFEYMYVGTRSGEMIMVPQEQLPSDYDPRTRPWYRDVTAANSAIVTSPYEDASSGELVVTFAMPSSQGVIGADVFMTDIVDFVLNVEFGTTGRAQLVDPSGIIIVSGLSDLLGASVSDVFGRLSQTEVLTVSSQGKDYLAALYSIPGTQWQVLMSIEADDAFAPLNVLLVTSLLLSLITVAVVVAVVVAINSVLLAPLKSLEMALKDISSGDADLTRRLTIERGDEIGRLSRYFNNFIESVHQLVIQVIDSAGQMQRLSQDTHRTATENNAQVQDQQSEISQVAAAIHEMATTSAAVAENASHAAHAAHQASDETKLSEKNATENQARMSELTHQIDSTTVVITELNDHAQQITKILATIQGIAEQTNLLALNAAIEAARAGEQGRGFAVVADEVRALSQRTHEATGEIQTMIEALRSRTESAVGQMQKSKGIVESTMTTASNVSASQASIKAAINSINAQAITISETAKEQNLATEEINRITQAIQDASQHLAENVESAYRQAEDLNQLGESIQSLLSRFRT